MGGLFGVASSTDCVYDLFYGVREIHMRPVCPPLIYSCEFLNFSTTRSTLNLAGRKMIHELGRKADCHLEAYADPDSEENLAMVECIRRRLRLTTFKHQRLDDLVTAIGLPREKLWTHCRDGSSYF